MFATPNEKTVNLKLSRHEVCKLCLALDAVVQTPGTSPEYAEIRRRVQEQLNAHDEAHRKEN